MNNFKFKKFEVTHSKSAMKVGTDAVLLGSYVKFTSEKRVLDVGTGSGIIALIAAQKSSAKIMGIDIHLPSILEAKKNFINSPWGNRLESKHISFQDFSKKSSKDFDMIISNPPFFNQSLKSPNNNKTIAKHNDNLSFKSFATCSDACLSEKGKVCVILPVNESKLFLDMMKERQLELIKECLIYPKPSKDFNRKILILKRNYQSFQNVIRDKLTIRNNDNSYTDEYKQLTKDLYLNL